jgi:hypothetical protein
VCAFFDFFFCITILVQIERKDHLKYAEVIHMFGL